jgi:glycosyltransferase involved in cell wall biosynthesis
MHVCIVDTTLTTPPTGGAQTFLVELCRAFVHKGWRVTIVTQSGPEGSVLASLSDVGAEVRDQIWRRAHLPEERGRALAAWVNSERPDAYVVSISPDVGWLALPLLDPSIATLSIAHNDVAAFYEPLRHYHPFIDCAIGVSEAIHHKIIEQCGVPSERVTHIPYGMRSLTPEQVGKILVEPGCHGVLRICYVGRLVQDQKRVLEFVPLVAELVRRRVVFELHLIGEGNERKVLEAQFRDQGLENRVTFCGWLASERIASKLLELDVFVLLSDHEGLPVALIEAMGHALVPVVTNIESGNTQLVQDGKNGFVVPIGDTKLTADCIQQLAENRDLLIRMKEAAWQTGHEFSVERMVDCYVSCIEIAGMRAGSREKRAGVPEPYPLMPSCRSKYPYWLRKLKSRLLDTRSASDFPTKSLP